MKSERLMQVDAAGIGVMALLVISWSFGPLIIHYFSLHQVRVWDQNACRYTIAVAALWSLVAFKYRRNRAGLREQLSGRAWRAALLPATPALLLQNVYALALYKLQPGLLSLLHKQYIIWAVLLAMILFPEERKLLRRPRFWMGFVCVICGAAGVVLFRGGIDFTPDQWLGVVLTVIFSLTTACYGIAIRRVVRIHVDPMVAYGMVSLYLLGPLWVISLLAGRPGSLWGAGRDVWGLMAVSALCNIALAHYAYYWVIRRMGVTLSHIFLMSTAFLTTLLSWPIFGERLTPWQWLSGAVLIGGAVLTILSEQRAVKNGAVEPSEPEEPKPAERSEDSEKKNEAEASPPRPLLKT